MKKASKWFRGLLGLKKPGTSSSSSSSAPTTSKPPPPPPPKKKWSFVKSYRETNTDIPMENKKFRNGVVVVDDHGDSGQRASATAVAAASAALAEAAVATAQAAVEVVWLTSSGRAPSANNNASTTSFGRGNCSSPAQPVKESVSGYGKREEWAAVKIQSHFRAYLSRRALRALRALVKLQALVRGHIVRKHCAEMLREVQAQMQAVLRVRARASAVRAQVFESPHKSNHNHYPGPATPEKFEHISRSKSIKHGENLLFRRNSSRNSKVSSNFDSRMDIKSREPEGSSVETGSRVNEVDDKVLEIDTARPQVMHKRGNLFHSSHLSIGSDQCSHSFTTSKESTAHQMAPSPSSCEVQSMSPLKFSHYVEEYDPFCTAANSPLVHSSSSKGDCSKRGPFTPTKSDTCRSCLSGYSDYPNYMSCTQSSKAKVRSLSAPKQRPHYERSSSTKRLSVYGYGEPKFNYPPQRVSALHASFTSKAYPGSGRLDRLGMPVREEAIGFSGGHWHRF